MTPDKHFAVVLDAIRIRDPAAGAMIRDYLRRHPPVNEAHAPFGGDPLDWLDDGLLEPQGSA